MAIISLKAFSNKWSKSPTPFHILLWWVLVLVEPRHAGTILLLSGLFDPIGGGRPRKLSRLWLLLWSWRKPLCWCQWSNWRYRSAPQVEPSFQADVVNKMIRAPDAASIASMLWLEALMGRKPGASTGTNLWDVFQVSWKMLHRQQSRSIVTVMCDSGERYLDAVNGWLVTWVICNVILISYRFE